jgi:hypothetical protein
MKPLLRTIFSPVLNPFEKGDEPFEYKSSSRTILLIVGCLFIGLSTAVTLMSASEDLSFLLVVVVFGGLGCLSLLIGSLGTDRAVANIWGSKRR